MNTYIINKEKDLKQFKDEYGYYIDGNVEFKIPIKINGRLEVTGYIEAGEFIDAGTFIKAGEYIEAGDYYGISAGSYITCKGVLKFGLQCFAGICTWREITDKDKIITCERMEGGTIEYGILKETEKEK